MGAHPYSLLRTTNALPRETAMALRHRSVSRETMPVTGSKGQPDRDVFGAMNCVWGNAACPGNPCAEHLNGIVVRHVGDKETWYAISGGHTAANGHSTVSSAQTPGSRAPS